ncbi:MAG: hypothetical protein KY391_08115, partial [Actinobacteria bacterium]|nr:hypothetical protein [Actinomycetota bacterium]
MQMTRAVVVAAALLGSALAAPSAADTARFSDPNDTPGKLDVKTVRHGHDGSRLVHNLSTYRRWNSRTLRGDETYIGFYLDDGT